MVLNFEFRFLKEIWDFGAKVLSRKRSLNFWILNIVQFFLQYYRSHGQKVIKVGIHCIDVALTDRLSSFLKRQQYFFASGLC